MSFTPAQAANPLINRPALPHGAPAFDLIKTEHFLPAIDWAIEKARANIAAITANTALPTFENTVEALEFASTDLSFIAGVFNTISAHMGNQAVQDVEKIIRTRMTEFGNDVKLDDTLFERVRAVHASGAGRALTGEKAMLLQKSHDYFAQNGALLDDAGKQALRALDEEISTLSTLFKNNLNNAESCYARHVTDAALLRGMPQRVLDRLAKNATDRKLAGWIVTAGDVPDVLTYCADRDVRRDLFTEWKSLNSQGAYDNRPVILNLVRARHERAVLLGHPNHAALVQQNRMAKNPATVQAFLEKNLAVYLPAARADIQEMQDFARQKDNITDLQAYDFAYYSAKLRERKFSVDMEEIRAYFSLDNALKGQHIHNEKLFGMTMVPADGKYPVWHPDVKVFEGRDTATGKTIALRYDDPFLRQDPDCKKRSGAWMNAIRNRGTVDGRDQIPLITNTCNFAPGTGGAPALLSPDGITTLYHEGGHGNHGMLAEGTYPSLNGTSVAWDFVELPSQLQENWAMEEEVLATYAFHHKTGQPIPATLVRKLKDMANFQAGYRGLRQTFLGLLDMKFHTTDPAAITSVDALEDSVAARASLFDRVGGTFASGFGHLFSSAVGYSAGYYSYKWAEVLDADAFTRFEGDLYNPAAARDLRGTIYSRGGTVEPGALFRAFMGRDPDPQALFRREGLAPPPAAPRQQPPAPSPS